MEDQGVIARNVRSRMLAMGLGPKALSLKAGLNETYVRDLLKGRSQNPRHAHLQSLANALDCRVSDLTEEGQNEAAPSDTKRDLLAAYEVMNEEQRRALLTVAKVMASPAKADESHPAPRPKRRPAA